MAINFLVAGRGAAAHQQAERLNIARNLIEDRGYPDRNNNRDAFRHAYTAAKMVIEARQEKLERVGRYRRLVPVGVQGLGDDVSEASRQDVIRYGEYFEQYNFISLLTSMFTRVDPRENDMDLHNNAVGAHIGADLPIDADDNMIGDAIYAAMQNGDLIIDLYDKRIEWYPSLDLYQNALKRAGLLN